MTLEITKEIVKMQRHTEIDIKQGRTVPRHIFPSEMQSLWSRKLKNTQTGQWSHFSFLQMDEWVEGEEIKEV